MQFGDRLSARVASVGSPACVGLDPHLSRLPVELDHLSRPEAVRVFALGTIEAVADVVAAVKPQVAFFEALGSPGVRVLEQVVRAARDAGLIVLLDAKRGDIGSTAEAYAHATLDDDGPMAADAVTVSPYLGPESLEPFLRRCEGGKGVFVLLRTSNPGAGPWQRAGIADHVASWVRDHNASRGEMFGPIGAVVGATLERGEIRSWRERLPRTWVLAPGFGPQGASTEDIAAAFLPGGGGALVPASRAVLFPATGRDTADWQTGIRRRALAFVSALGPHALPSRP